LNGASKKFDSQPPRDAASTAALDEHLRGIAYRNGRGAALFLAGFTFVLWPTDWIVFYGLHDVQRTVVFVRLAIIGTALATWGLLSSRIGPRRPILILGGGGALLMGAIGWGLGTLGGADAPFIHLAYPAFFFSVLAPVRGWPRVALVGALWVALFAGFLGLHPEHRHHSMVFVMLSFTASLSAMVLAVGHLSFRILRQSFYQQVEIGELNDTLESRVREQTQDLRRLTAHLEHVQEEERARISRELHDELGQELTALHLALTLTQQRFAKDPQSIRANLGDLDALVLRTRTTTRNLVSDLRPRILDELGLGPAIEWLIRRTEERSSLQCKLETSGIDGLSKELSNVAFRIVQEAITNVVRHAQATRIDIRLARAPGALELSVRDDGVGIDLQKPPNGFGLLGIRERVSALRGELSLARADGGGTLLRAQLPLTQEAS
jgi:signal transduction histidine kinase